MRRENNSEINTLIMGILIFALVTAFIIMIKAYGSQPYTVYAQGNDGCYYAITYSPCKVLARTETELVIEYNGNAYACYYDGNEKPGDIVWAGFAQYGNEVDFVDVQKEARK